MRYRTLSFYVSILDTYNVRIDMSAQQYNSSHYCMGLFSEHTFGLLPSDQMLLKCESYNIHVFRSLSIRIKIFFMFVIFKSSSPISLKPIYLFFSQNPFKGICFNIEFVQQTKKPVKWISKRQLFYRLICDKMSKLDH